MAIDSEDKSSKSFDSILRIVVGSMCIIFSLLILSSGDFGFLFSVTPGGNRLRGIPLFMILIVGLVALISPFINSDSKKKNKK